MRSPHPSFYTWISHTIVLDGDAKHVFLTFSLSKDKEVLFQVLDRENLLTQHLPLLLLFWIRCKKMWDAPNY